MAHTFVKDVMISDIAELDVSDAVKDAAIIMDKKNIGCIIVTKNKIPVGIITERDFVKKVAAQEISLNSKLETVMSSPLIEIDSEQTVWEAAQIMKTKNIHKLPVRQNNSIIGIVTTTDLVKICSLGSDSEMRRICDQIITRMERTSK
ncbi:MAG: CBS domain-containing protein [Nitrosarchaeum sp.]|nr:CBS domain-containing protein [Nitrosarchaeum sp.]MCA9820176.1 CBS domain-containing protein [Nitrosarchaeum sp.]